MAPDGARPARFEGHEYPQTLPEPDDIQAGAVAPWSALSAARANRSHARTRRIAAAGRAAPPRQLDDPRRSERHGRRRYRRAADHPPLGRAGGALRRGRRNAAGADAAVVLDARAPRRDRPARAGAATLDETPDRDGAARSARGGRYRRVLSARRRVAEPHRDAGARARRSGPSSDSWTSAR